MLCLSESPYARKQVEDVPGERVHSGACHAFHLRISSATSRAAVFELILAR